MEPFSRAKCRVTERHGPCIAVREMATFRVASHRTKLPPPVAKRPRMGRCELFDEIARGGMAVSYTHLTLPTIYSV